MNQLESGKNVRTNTSECAVCMCCVSLKIQSSIGSTSTYLSLSGSLLSDALHRKSVVMGNYAPQPKAHTHTHTHSLTDKQMMENSALYALAYLILNKRNERITVSTFFIYHLKKVHERKTKKRSKRQYRKMNRAMLLSAMVMMKNLSIQKDKRQQQQKTPARNRKRKRNEIVNIGRITEDSVRTSINFIVCEYKKGPCASKAEPLLNILKTLRHKNWNEKPHHVVRVRA